MISGQLTKSEYSNRGRKAIGFARPSTLNTSTMTITRKEPMMDKSTLPLRPDNEINRIQITILKVQRIKGSHFRTRGN
jgi:hypothetical protein